MIEPKVCIVIVNWNKKDFVVSLIQSLNYIVYKNYDIVVVDNASDDGSIESIQKFKNVKLICNTDNLGGTGGFNTGITYALNQNCYKYIWLLDNDAQIRSDSLSELVKVCEGDERIGAAGSMIVNPDIEGIVVELGAFVSWKDGTWKPNMRNQLIPPETEQTIFDVDYIAACSALVRVDAVSRSGIMDERFFLHWDDIDLCLRISKAGYRIVAVSTSKIYHEVEKGSNPVLAYYDIRNGLLAISKHLSGINRVEAMFNLLRGSCKSIAIYYLSGMKSMAKLITLSIYDFLIGHFYKFKHNIGQIHLQRADIPIDFKNYSKYFSSPILILPNGTSAEIYRIWDHMESLGFKNMFLLIQDDRKNLFSDIESHKIISFDVYRHSNWKMAKLFYKLFRCRYLFFISPTPMCLPYSYIAKKVIYFDKQNNCFYEAKESIRMVWNLLVSFIAGELIALILLPITFIIGNKYQRPRENVANQSF